MILFLVGADVTRDANGRVARFDLIPLDDERMEGRPRIDVLCNMSGIFRDVSTDDQGMAKIK